MAKKKKKYTVKQGEHSPSALATDETSSIQESVQIKILQKHITSTTSVREKAFGIILSKGDTQALDIMPSEKVILLSKPPDGNKYTQMVIGSLFVRSHLSVSSTPRSPTSRKDELSPGFAQVASSTLTDALFPSNDIQSALSPTPTIPTTPTTPKGSFSFRDQVNTSTSSFSSPQATPSKTPAKLVTLLPLDSDLGDVLRSRQCRSASVVHCRLLEDSTSEAAVTMLESLMRAAYQGVFIPVGIQLPLSFQGKIRTVEVFSIEAADELKELTCRLEDIDLQNGDWPLLQELDARVPLLYHINHATTIKWDILVEVASENPNTAARVAGLEQVQQALSSHLEGSKHAEHGTRGILLFGASGVGKTSLVKQIAARAKSTHDVSFVNCALLQAKTGIVGDAERYLSQHFQVKKEKLNKKGKLLIFDDVHLICPRRGGHDRGVDQLAATLLALMDGISKDSTRDFVIIAITRDPSQLDTALRRPGRLDNEIEVPLPDSAQVRGNILKLHLETAQIQSNISEATWEDLGKLAKGFNGADCALAVKEAVRLTLLQPRASPTHVSVEDLKTAIRVTKPSIIQSITVEIPKVDWSMIGGMDAVKQELREAIDMSDEKLALFEKLKIPPPRGILLYGPPGCSKTLMARALATEGHYNFLAVKGPELLSKWLGESERALASLFRRARMASPCIVFFDEVDAIASRRGDSASSGRLLSQLLTELDGVTTTTKHRVIVVAATNRPDLLDRALTRPGRIDRQIYVGVPDHESRRHILEISLREKSCSDDLDLYTLSVESEGLSGAELVAVCRDAALLALEEEKDSLNQGHLLRALSSMQRQITPEMLSFYQRYRENTTITF